MPVISNIKDHLDPSLTEQDISEINSSTMSTASMAFPSNLATHDHQPSYNSLYPSGIDYRSPRLTPDELPGYSSGVSVKKSDSKASPLLILNINNDAREGYFYQTGGVVTGSVVVHPYADLTIDCVFIDLQLVESVKRFADFPSTRIFHKTSIANFTPPLSAYPSDMVLEKGMAYTFEFSLQIPETRPLQACKSGLHYNLPSSLGSLPESGAYNQSFGPNVDVSDSSANIYYCVRARLMHTPTRILSQHVAHIWVMPWNDVDVDNRRESVSSFGSASASISAASTKSSIHDDTSFQASKTISSGFLRKSILGITTIDVEKPRKFDIFSNSPTFLSSKITFKTANAQAKPPLIKSINVKAILLTTVSSTGTDFTLSERIPIHTNTDVVQLQKLDVTSNTSWEVIDKGKYQTIVQLPVNIPEGDLRFVPSFKSCLVERSYELNLSVNFEGGSSVEVRVPIKLVCKRRRGNRGLYRINSKGSNKRYSISSMDYDGDDGDDVAPMYTLN